MNNDNAYLRPVSLLMLLPLLLVLSACQSWYKRGAGGEQLMQDQRFCREQTGSGSEQAFVDCMQGKGWSRSSHASEYETVETSAPHAATDSISNKNTGSAEESNTADKTSVTRPSTTETQALPREGSEPEIKTPPLPQPAATPAAPPGAWFKFGASPAQLELDRQACGASDHMTADTDAAVTKAFIACMREKGWRPLGRKPAPPR